MTNNSIGKVVFISCLQLILILLIVWLISACTAISFFKADEAPDYGFVPKATLLKSFPGQSPFQRSWITENKLLYNELKLTYTKVYIKPVNTNIVEENISNTINDDWLSKIRIEEAKEAALYFSNKLKLVVDNYPNHPLSTIDEIESDSFTINLAIVEIKPTNPAINAIGTAAGFFIPGSGLIKGLAKGGVAIEGYITDSNTGELLEGFKDREIDKAAPFSVRDFQEYAHVRTSIDDWSQQIAEILAKPIGHNVEDSLPFSINPF